MTRLPGTTWPKNENTRSKLWLGHFGKGDFEVGDFVELNWDGRVRKVQEVGESCIVIDPPLDEPPRCHDFTVSNWKQNANFALDLRLADDSPGKNLGNDGQEVGSHIDIQAYRKGDFNGNGKPRHPGSSEGTPAELNLNRLRASLGIRNGPS